MLDKPGWNWHFEFFLLEYNHAPRLEGEYFIAPLKVFIGPQVNTTYCSLLHVVANFMIFMGFNVGPESELAVLVISNILDHDYISWIIHI